MPADIAVSTRPVPFGTCTSRSSIVTRTSSVIPRTASLSCSGNVRRRSRRTRTSLPWCAPPPCRRRRRDRESLPRSSRVDLLRDGRVVVLVDGREEVREGAVLAERAATGAEVLAELGAELRDTARHRHRSGVTEDTQAL